MTKKLRRFLATLLALSMLLSMVGVNALAEERAETPQGDEIRVESPVRETGGAGSGGSRPSSGSTGSGSSRPSSADVAELAAEGDCSCSPDAPHSESSLTVADGDVHYYVLDKNSNMTITNNAVTGWTWTADPEGMFRSGYPQKSGTTGVKFRTTATPGTAVFTGATAEGSITVTIHTVDPNATPVEPIPVTGVSLDKDALELEQGKTATLVATVLPENATDKTVSWGSSDDSVATVENGAVTAVGAGTATITVTTTDGGKTATCAVTVTAPAATHAHSWAEAWTSDETHHWHECTVTEPACDVTEDSGKDGYAEHVKDAGTVTREATETEAGIKTFKCEVCGHVMGTEEIPATGAGCTCSQDAPHQSYASDSDARKAPLSVTEGSTHYITVNSKDSGTTVGRILLTGYGTEFKDDKSSWSYEPTGIVAHKSGEGTTSHLFGIVKAGTTKLTVKLTGGGSASFTLVVVDPSACDHAEVTKVEAKDPTCTDTGNIEHWACTQCGALFADEAHTTSLTKTDVTIAAQGHDWNAGEITKEPTCQEEGEKTYTCQRDAGHTYTETLEMVEHSFVDGECTMCHMVDTAKLKAAVAEAQAKKTGVTTAAEAGEVPSNQKWVTEAEMTQLNAALAAAQKIVDDVAANGADATSTKADAQAALTALEDAITNFVPKDGSAVEQCCTQANPHAVFSSSNAKKAENYISVTDGAHHYVTYQTSNNYFALTGYGTEKSGSNDDWTVSSATGSVVRKDNINATAQLFQAAKPGDATLTVALADGTTATITITVLDPNAVPAVVTFLDREETVVATVNTFVGQKLTAPAVPSLPEGYAVRGWYPVSEGVTTGVAWDFDTDTVTTEALTLKADYGIPYTVNFYKQGTTTRVAPSASGFGVDGTPVDLLALCPAVEGYRLAEGQETTFTPSAGNRDVIDIYYIESYIPVTHKLTGTVTETVTLPDLPEGAVLSVLTENLPDQGLTGMDNADGQIAIVGGEVQASAPGVAYVKVENAEGALLRYYRVEVQAAQTATVTYDLKGQTYTGTRYKSNLADGKITIQTYVGAPLPLLEEETVTPTNASNIFAGWELSKTLNQMLVDGKGFPYKYIKGNGEETTMKDLKRKDLPNAVVTGNVTLNATQKPAAKEGAWLNIVARTTSGDQTINVRDFLTVDDALETEDYGFSVAEGTVTTPNDHKTLEAWTVTYTASAGSSSNKVDIDMHFKSNEYVLVGFYYTDDGTTDANYITPLGSVNDWRLDNIVGGRTLNLIVDSGYTVEYKLPQAAIDDGAALPSDVEVYFFGSQPTDQELGGGAVMKFQANPSVQFTSELKLQDLPVPKDANYVINGWYNEGGGLSSGTVDLAKDLGNLDTDEDHVIHLSATYDVRGKDYVLNYDGNAPEGAAAQVENLHAQEKVNSANESYTFTVAAMVPTLEGYTFQGWLRDKQNYEPVRDVLLLGAHDDVPADTITLDYPVWGDSASTTLYAVWKQNKDFKIVYDANLPDGSDETVTGLPETETFSSAEDTHTFQVAAGEPKRDGYVFKGWLRDVKSGIASVQRLKAGDDVTIFYNSSSTTTTLYADWVEATVPVTFKIDGGGAFNVVNSELIQERKEDLAVGDSITINWQSVPGGWAAVAATVQIGDGEAQAMSAEAVEALNGKSASGSYTGLGSVSYTAQTLTGPVTISITTAPIEGYLIAKGQGTQGRLEQIEGGWYQAYTDASNPDNSYVQEIMTVSENGDELKGITAVPASERYVFDKWTDISGTTVGTDATLVVPKVENSPYGHDYESTNYYASFKTRAFTVEASFADPTKCDSIELMEGKAFADEETKTLSHTLSYGEVVDLAFSPIDGYELSNIKIYKKAIGATEYTEDTSYQYDPEVLTGYYLEQDGLNFDLKVVAYVEPIAYSITYKGMENATLGTDAEGKDITNPTEYKMTTETFTLNNPSKTGYTFAGWTGTDLEKATKSVSVDKGSTGDRTYTATWTLAEYTITYDLDGGKLIHPVLGIEVPDANPTKYTVETEDFTLANPSKTGYTFAGWTGTGLESATEIVSVDKGSTGDRAYTATWTANEAEIVFETNGGTKITTMKGVTGQAISDTKIPETTKAGYSLEGWYANNKFEGEKVKALPEKYPAGTTTYYAKWTADTDISYTVKYVDEAGTEIADQKLVENQTMAATVKEQAKTISGYTVKEGENEKSLTLAATGNEIVFHYTTNEYKITYDLKDGALAKDVTNPETYKVTTETFTLNNPGKTGYTFAGWTGTGLESATETVSVDKGSTGDRSYTATWTVNQYSYTVEYYYDGVKDESKTVTGADTDYGAKIESYEAKQTSGYTLSKTENLPLTISEDETKNVIKVYYITDDGQTKKLSYTVEYYKDGVKVEADTQVEEETVQLLAPDTLTVAKNKINTTNKYVGYQLKETDPTTIPDTVENGATIKVYYEAEEYSITYDLKGGALAKDVTNPETYKVTTETFTLNNPGKAGYTFAGWTGTGLGSATKTVSVAKGSTGDRSYTATWQPVLYDVTYAWSGLPETLPALYDADGSSVTLTKPTGLQDQEQGTTHVVDTTYQKDDVVYTHDGYGNINGKYTFGGWDKSGTLTIDAADIEIKGKWSYETVTVDTYTVSYDWTQAPSETVYDEETGEEVTLTKPVDNNTYYRGQNHEVDTVWPGKAVYTKDAYGNKNTTYTLAASWTKSVDSVTGNVSYTAAWTKVDEVVRFHITYDLAGGTLAEGVTNPETYTVETETFTLNDPTRANYTFLGWTGSNGETAQTEVSVVKGTSGNLTYTASWAPDRNHNGVDDTQEYRTVTYTDGVADATVFADQVYTELSAGVRLLPGDKTPAFVGTPSRSGYTFEGWTPTVAETITTDAVYTATWKRVSNSGGGGGYVPPTPVNPPEEELEDPDVPLADLPTLNTEDHMAYLIGRPDGTIAPLDNITRGEVATIFFRLLSQESRDANWSTSCGYTDMEGTEYFYNPVSTATKAGLIQGYPDGTFGGGDRITRGEMAAIAARFLSEAYSGEELFTDTQGHWAQEYINRAAKAGWFKTSNADGTPVGEFRPNDYITRAEVVVMINRMLGRKADMEHLLAEMKTWPDNVYSEQTAWYYLDIQEATNSHDYTREGFGQSEVWTALKENPDWAALERR